MSIPKDVKGSRFAFAFLGLVFLLWPVRISAQRALTQFPQNQFPQVENSPSSSQVTEGAVEEFRLEANEFAAAYNDLMKDMHGGLVPIKKANRVKDLFEKLMRHPAWPIHNRH